MADILKITTPLMPKNHNPQVQKNMESDVNFQLSDITKVIKPNSDSGVNSQNNSFVDKDATSNLLSNLLKDPAVTITYLKNIFLLQEVVKLLPVNNSTFTQEIQMLFNSLLVPMNEVVDELKKQENSSTAFKGKLFDFLRNFVDDNKTLDAQSATANFLKALNGETSKKNVLTSIKNCLQFIRTEMNSSTVVTEDVDNILKRLDIVIDSYAQPKNSDQQTIKEQQLKGQLNLLNDELQVEGKMQGVEKLNTQNIKTLAKQVLDGTEFKDIKQNILEFVTKLQESILYNSKVEKISSIMVYNLSRFRENPIFLREATDVLLTYINDDQQKLEFIDLLKDFLFNRENGEQIKSKIMSTLSEIMEKQAFSKEVTAINSDKIEKIINSLLSSPCSFTPLLHFIVPVEYLDMKSFAEIWVDVDEDSTQDEVTGEKQDNLHMLIVFEVEGIGQFESEIFVRGKEISLQLFCPSGYTKVFKDVDKKISENIKGSTYVFKEILVADLTKQRSLMDAFKDLPRKRTGLDIVC